TDTSTLSLHDALPISVEQRTVNPWVAGSSPARGAKLKRVAIRQPFFISISFVCLSRQQPGSFSGQKPSRQYPHLPPPASSGTGAQKLMTRLGDFLLNLPQRRQGVRRFRNRTPNHEIVASRSNGVRRR